MEVSGAVNAGHHVTHPDDCGKRRSAGVIALHEDNTAMGFSPCCLPNITEPVWCQVSMPYECQTLVCKLTKLWHVMPRHTVDLHSG